MVYSLYNFCIIEFYRNFFLFSFTVTHGYIENKFVVFFSESVTKPPISVFKNALNYLAVIKSDKLIFYKMQLNFIIISDRIRFCIVIIKRDFI